MHPTIESFLLTPIAPRSLSFRTLLLPSSCELRMQVGRAWTPSRELPSPRERQISKTSRAPSELSIDGREVCMLNPGESVVVTRSEFPVPCITRREGGDDWVADIKWVAS